MCTFPVGDHDRVAYRAYTDQGEQGGKPALLKDQWKAVRLEVGRDPEGALQLFNLETDPAEQVDLAGEHPDLVESFSRLMAAERSSSELFNSGR